MGYNGLRMTADEYLALGETQERYELIDGVVVMSPSPTPPHNEIAWQIGHQLGTFAEQVRPVRVFPETDLRLTDGKVYRPDLSVYLAERLPKRPQRLDTPPDLVVEVLSPGSKPLDYITKRDDYDRFGVGEYWVVDPADGGVKCWRRQEGAGGRMAEVIVEGETWACVAIPGFTLDLVAVRGLAGA